MNETLDKMQMDAGERNDPSWHELFDFVHNEHGIDSNPALVVAVVRAALARWGRPATQLEPGELSELVTFLKHEADELDYQFESGPSEKMRRAATLLERLSDLAADAVAGMCYIEQSHGRLYGVGWDRVYAKADALNPQLFASTELMPESLLRGLEQAQKGEFVEPPDLV